MKPAMGVIFHPRFAPEGLAAYARRAEAAGFDELWLWDDCFLPGAFTSTALALAATEHIRVGIGLLPVPAYHPLFAAMELTTLARAYPGRILPGFGHGVRGWMEQMGVAPRSPLRALEETLQSVRALLHGERVALDGEYLHLDGLQMETLAAAIPPLYVGGMRAKTLALAGRLADGVILTGNSPAPYVNWALAQVRAAAQAAGRPMPRSVLYLDTKISLDGDSARAAVRRTLAQRLPMDAVQLETLGIAQAAAELAQRCSGDLTGAAESIPDSWVDGLSAAGDPEQVRAALSRWAATGVDSIVLQPLNGDPACLEEYVRWLSPVSGVEKY